MRICTILLACVFLMGIVTTTAWGQIAAGSTYIVRAGDSYHSIATRHGISLSQLHDLNPGIYVHGSAPQGQILRVPIGGMYSPSAVLCPLLHIVNPNETLDWISGAYGVALGDLAHLNSLGVQAALVPGSALCLPIHARLQYPAPVTPAPAAPFVTVPVAYPIIPSTYVAGSHVPVGPWTGYYYNNLGAPVYVTSSSDSHINFNWRTGSPAAGVAADYFSAVWLGNFYFTGQNYRFVALADDGVRVWVGDVLVIDGWQEQAATLYYRDYAPPAGTRPVRVEYYDATIYAQLTVDWAPH